MLNIVKNTTILNPLDLISPHSCRGCGHIGEALCNKCKNYIISARETICPRCKAPITDGICMKCPTTFPPVYSIGAREGLLSTLIHDFKYHSTRAIGIKLAELLDASLPHHLTHVTIVPLPTATHHIRARGLDHTYLIAKHLAKLRACQVQTLLLRTRNTVQVGASKATRKAQADAAYAINDRIPIDPTATYLLLDDVWTTGASMESAIKKLQQAGAQNLAIALLAISRN